VPIVRQPIAASDRERLVNPTEVGRIPHRDGGVVREVLPLPGQLVLPPSAWGVASPVDQVHQDADTLLPL
jgi:hypothetical protein